MAFFRKNLVSFSNKNPMKRRTVIKLREILLPMLKRKINLKQAFFQDQQARYLDQALHFFRITTKEPYFLQMKKRLKFLLYLVQNLKKRMMTTLQVIAPNLRKSRIWRLIQQRAQFTSNTNNCSIVSKKLSFQNLKRIVGKSLILLWRHLSYTILKEKAITFRFNQQQLFQLSTQVLFSQRKVNSEIFTEKVKVLNCVHSKLIINQRKWKPTYSRSW